MLSACVYSMVSLLALHTLFTRSVYSLSHETVYFKTLIIVIMYSKYIYIFMFSTTSVLLRLKFQVKFSYWLCPLVKL